METILRAPVLIKDLYLNRDFGIRGMTLHSVAACVFFYIGVSFVFFGLFKLYMCDVPLEELITRICS
jgi:hypothetical protein